MFSEENAKRKGKPRNRWPLVAILLPLLACLVMCGISWLILTRHSSDVPLLDGLSSEEQAEAVILERLPIGSTRAEVETFISEQLQPSETVICYSSDEIDSICRQAIGRVFLCSYMIWDIEFRFENEALAKIRVSHFAGCM